MEWSRARRWIFGARREPLQEMLKSGKTTPRPKNPACLAVGKKLTLSLPSEPKAGVANAKSCGRSFLEAS